MNLNMLHLNLSIFWKIKLEIIYGLLHSMCKCHLDLNIGVFIFLSYSYLSPRKRQRWQIFYLSGILTVIFIMPVKTSILKNLVIYKLCFLLHASLFYKKIIFNYFLLSRDTFGTKFSFQIFLMIYLLRATPTRVSKNKRLIF